MYSNVYVTTLLGNDGRWYFPLGVVIIFRKNMLGFRKYVAHL